MEIIIRKNCCIVIFLISVFIASALPPAYAEEALPVIRPGGKDFEQAVKGMRQEFVDIAIEGMKNTAGIFYEVPIVTSIVNLRNIMPRVRLEKIGVIHRSFSEQLVRINQDYCRKEHTELVPYLISDKGDIESELKKGLDILEKKENIDALWVLNDSILVNAQLLRSAWIPFARKFKKLPLLRQKKHHIISALFLFRKWLRMNIREYLLICLKKLRSGQKRNSPFICGLRKEHSNILMKKKLSVFFLRWSRFHRQKFQTR